MIKAAIYCRVSTDEQARHGYSLQTQLDGCRLYAEQHGFEVVDELLDDCSGTIPIIDRPQGRHIYELADAGAIGAVILYTHDRTARDEKVIEYQLLKSHLFELGIELHYSDTGLDAYTMESNLIGYIKAYEAARERKKITERTMRGKFAKASKDGNPVMGGYPPFGYDKVGVLKDAYLRINEHEASIVQTLFEWYVYGENGSQPMSLRSIVRALNERGITPPNHRSNAAKRWIPATIMGILKNPIYTGVTYYGKSKMVGIGKHKHRVQQPRDKWIEIPVPELAIIGIELYEAAQARAKRNKERAKRNRKHNYLLTGHFRCGCCNNAMVGSKRTSRGVVSFYYTCGNYWRTQECEKYNKSISTSKCDTLVWDWLYELISDEDKLRMGLRRLAEQKRQEVEPRRRRLDAVIGEIEKLDKKIERLVINLSDEEDEILADAIKTQVRTFTKQKVSFEEERARLEAELQRQEITAEYEDKIVERAAVLRQKITKPSYALKREILDVLDVQVVFYDDEDGRRLFVSCGIKPEGSIIMLHPS